MSQTTANDLLIGLNADTRDADPIVKWKRHPAILIASAIVLLAGFKFLGDSACNYAIDSWSERQRASLSSVDPETAAIVARLVAEDEDAASVDTVVQQ
jgi:hypothetical protein